MKVVNCLNNKHVYITLHVHITDIRMSAMTQLHLHQPLPWLQQTLVLDPLLLLPGDGDGVAIEASLLLATSPLLRTLATSSPSCSCSSHMVNIPSTTYQVHLLLHLVDVNNFFVSKILNFVQF